MIDRPRLQAGIKETGRGMDRRDISVVTDDKDRTIVRYEYRRFSENLSHSFLRGRDRAWSDPVDPNAIRVEMVRGGDPPFVSTHAHMSIGDVEVHVANDQGAADAWIDGLRHGLKERGMLSKSGRLKTAKAI